MPKITEPTHELTFGPVNLIGTADDLTTLGYVLNAEGDDADWGNPVPIEQKIITWLQDGAIVGLEGYDNRELFLRVRVTAESDAGLEAGEMALMLQTGRRNTLTWTPPGEDANASVFSVVMSHLEQITDHLAELDYRRTYGLRVTAEPFIRADYAVTAVAVPEFVPEEGEDPVTTTFDDGTSATDWSMVPVRSGSVSVVSGQIQLSTNTTSPSAVQGLFRDDLGGDLGGMVYVRARIPFANADVMPRWTVHIVPPPYTLSQSVSYWLNGAQVTPAFKSGDDVYFSTAGLGLSLETFEVRVTAAHTGPIGPMGYGLRFRINVDEIEATNTANPSAGNGRQVSAIVDVAGSARTVGNLAIEYLTTDGADFFPLGETLVYTCPDDTPGYWPGMRDFTAGTAPTETPDASLIAGSWISIASGAGGGPWRVEYPVAQVPPGGFLLVARVRRATAGNSVITATTGVNNGTADVGPTQELVWSGALTTDFEIKTLGTLMLPSGDIGSAGKVWIELESESGDAVRVDEAWLFNIETGRLTWVTLPNDGVVGPSRMWLNAPSVDVPRPQILVGNEADLSDAYHPGDVVEAFGVHEFKPPRAKVFVASTGDGTGVPQITLTHNPRFHTHVATAPTAPVLPRVGLVQTTTSIDTWTYPDDAIEGDMMIACGFIANDAIVTANGWDLLDDSLDTPGIDYRPVVYTKPYDGTTTMPTVAAAAGDHLLIAATYADVDTTDVAAGFDSISTGIYAAGVATEKLSLFGYTAPVLDIDEFVLADCTKAAAIAGAATGPAALELTVKLSSGSSHAEQPDTGTDYDVAWFAVSIGLS